MAKIAGPLSKTMVGTQKSRENIYQPKIAVIGIGGGGGSIVGEIARKISKKKLPHRNRIKFIIANVDAQALKGAPRQAKTFYFGQELTHGLGCGMNPELGKKAALQAKKDIEKLLKKSDFCLFVACLGGGTGSGAAPIFAQAAKGLEILSWGIFTKPFSFEGREKFAIARHALGALKPNLNAVTVLSNQKIFKIVDQKTPIQKSLSTMNGILINTLEGLIETLYSPGIINLDFADFRAVLEKANSLAYLNCEEFSGLKRAEKAIQAVLKNPLIDYDISGAESILFNIAGAKDLRMAEVENICRAIYAFNPRAKIIFGVSQNNQYKNKIKITLIAVGCGQLKTIKTQKSATKRKQKPKKQPLPEKKEIKELKEKEEKSKELKDMPPEIIKKDSGKIEKKSKEEKKTKALKKVLRRKVKISKKNTIRRNALDLHKQAEEDEKKMLEEESKWETPAFLRKNHEF